MLVPVSTSMGVAATFIYFGWPWCILTYTVDSGKENAVKE